MSRSISWRPPAFDVALASVLLALGEAQIHSPDPHRVIANKVFSAIVWGLTAPVLAWRRRLSWVAFSVVVLGVTVEALPAPDSGTIAGFAALCVALYTVGREEPELNKTVAASAVALLALIFHYARDPMASNSVESIQATYAVLLFMPVLGRLLGARTARAAALEVELADQEHKKIEAARAATAQERARIARELHDVIAHAVSVAIIQSMAARSALADGHLEHADRRLGSIEDTARKALADMRRLVAIDEATERAGDPVPQPGLSELAALVANLAATGTDVALENNGLTPGLSPGADVALYRIAQEALTNAITHAPGAPIRVRVGRYNGVVSLEVENGIPTGVDAGPGSGRGLLGMRQRIALYGGTLEAGPSDAGGFRVCATLPVEGTSA